MSRLMEPKAVSVAPITGDLIDKNAPPLNSIGRGCTATASTKLQFWAISAKIVAAATFEELNSTGNTRI